MENQSEQHFPAKPGTSKHMVLKIFSKKSGRQNGLYVAGELTADPDIKKQFRDAFANREVKVIRTHNLAG